MAKWYRSGLLIRWFQVQVLVGVPEMRKYEKRKGIIC